MKIKNSSSKRYLFIGLFAIICAVADCGSEILALDLFNRYKLPLTATAHMIANKPIKR